MYCIKLAVHDFQLDFEVHTEAVLFLEESAMCTVFCLLGGNSVHAEVWVWCLGETSWLLVHACCSGEEEEDDEEDEGMDEADEPVMDMSNEEVCRTSHCS